MSEDAKWIIGILVAAIVGIWKEFRRMHREGIVELKETNAHLADHSIEIALIKTHTKETKHAIQQLPCKAIEEEEEEKKPVRVIHGESQ